LDRFSDNSKYGLTNSIYSNGKRTIIQDSNNEIIKDNLRHYNIGFSTSKMRADDLEKFYDAGFSRSGTYFQMPL